MCGPGFFCANSSSNNFKFAKEDKGYSQYEKNLLPNNRLPILEFQQNDIHAEDHLVSSCQGGLLTAKNRGFRRALGQLPRNRACELSTAREYLKWFPFYQKDLKPLKHCFVRKNWVLCVSSIGSCGTACTLYPSASQKNLAVCWSKAFSAGQATEHRTGPRICKVNFHEVERLSADRTEIGEHR